MRAKNYFPEQAIVNLTASEIKRNAFIFTVMRNLTEYAEETSIDGYLKYNCKDGCFWFGMSQVEFIKSIICIPVRDLVWEHILVETNPEVNDEGDYDERNLRFQLTCETEKLYNYLYDIYTDYLQNLNK